MGSRQRQAKRHRLARRHGLTCSLCGRWHEHQSALSIDHRWPRSRAGDHPAGPPNAMHPDDFANLRLACYGCNRDKANALPGGTEF